MTPKSSNVFPPNLLLFRFLTTKTALPSNQSPLCNNLYFSHNTLFLHSRSTSTLQEARKLHGLLLVHGHLHQNPSPVLGAQLVNTYITFNSVQEAFLLFTHLPKRNSFAWNSILKGLVDVGHFSEAIELYHNMMSEGVFADNFTYPLVLRSCSGLSDIELGRNIQKCIEFDTMNRGLKPNIYTQCALVDMFAKCGSLGEARKVFDDMPMRDLVSWGAMICGTMQSGDWSEALGLFRRMRMEGLALDSVVMATVVPACGRLGALELGMGLHCCVMKSGFGNDLCVSNSLIDMYCKCGEIQVAHRLFQYVECKDAYSWSSLIAGYSLNCEHRKNSDLFYEMTGLGIKPSSVTLASVLPSFSELKLIQQGKEIHGYAIRHGCGFDVFIASALVDLYCKCGQINEAGFIFEIMLDKDIAIANSMITGYALNGYVDSALRTIRRIQETGLRPDTATIVTVLPLCSRFNMLKQGKELHGYAIRNGLGSEVSVNNSLIDMYCKCGHLDLGKKVFHKTTDREIVTYNTIITAFGMHGLGNQAILYFDYMEKERIEPNNVTFIALLSACSHAGLVDKGLFFYNSMVEDYGILPDMEHYSCMVDLYGRAGCLDDAWDVVIQKMPMEPGVDVMGSLLGACRVHKRLDLAERISNWFFEMKLEDPGYHVLLANIYADAGRWEDAKKVRSLLKEKGLVKKPGNSWIQVGSHVHSFLARDCSHPEFHKICSFIPC